VARVLAIPVVVLVLAGGFYLISRNVPTGGLVAIGAGVAWVVVAGAIAAWLARRDRALLGVVLGSAVFVAVVGGFLIAPKASEVDEVVVTAAPMATKTPEKPRNMQLASGHFTGQSGHSGQGRAAVIKLAKGGRVLTFRNFDVDPGAGGLRVYMVAGRPSSDSDVKDFVELAHLKGTKGNQQYRLPSSLSLKRYPTVVIWCVPFTTRIAQAPLR
jgi:Electron transfer DM13